MSDNPNLKKYIEYTEVLREKLDEYFKDQKEFIKCKAGCGICCTTSYYPVSQLEYEYIRMGLTENFSEKEIDEINKAAIKILKDRREFTKTNSNVLDYAYACPFLVNGSCGIYKYRALLCRSHGLIYKDITNPNKNNIPHCVELGLNYSNVFDKETKKISLEKIKELGIKSTPQAYDLSYSVMMQEAGDIDFGDIRMLIEWIIMDIPNYEELIKEDSPPEPVST